MDKRKITACCLILFLAGCSVKYTSRIQIPEPFQYKTKMSVWINSEVPFVGLAYSDLENDIKKSIEDDIRLNIFPNMVLSDADVLVEAMVQSISNNLLTGRCSCTISLTISCNNVAIKRYAGSGSGFRMTTAGGIIVAVKKAMEHIKMSIIQDRDEIKTAIENQKFGK
ncbi:MAG: hypothetical protein AB1393_06090 [Candidatus Edwardsbacteria bacterium]